MIIQGGRALFETVDGAVAEPVVHDGSLRGGRFLPRPYRARPRREPQRAGHALPPLAFETCCSLPDSAQGPDAPPNRFYAYGVVARLALLAASVEIEETAPVELAELAA